jgi:eukaryotic-like serine/threonine-protein kinase
MDAVGPGSILGETYELIELLGRGGMGVVWTARHLRLPKQVALKLLTPAAQASEVTVARFRREAEIASRLGHPHIVEVLDFNVLPDGVAYIVMELLKGEDLRRRLSRGPLPAEQALTVLLQVASALQAAHQAGVVHRDLKPENIFLTMRPGAFGPELCVKVLDFGISKIQSAQTLLTQDDAMIGTPAYMSPEQAAGKSADVDGRSDLFALATIGYEMLSGRCPFAGSSLAEVVHKVVFEEAPSLQQLAPSVPEPVSRAIDRGMAKDRQRRFPDVGAFVSAITGRGEAAPPAIPSAAAGAGGPPPVLGVTLPVEGTPPASFAATLPVGAAAPATLPADATALATPPRATVSVRRALLIGSVLAVAGGAGLLVVMRARREVPAPRVVVAKTPPPPPASLPAVRPSSRAPATQPAGPARSNVKQARPPAPLARPARRPPRASERPLPPEVKAGLDEARAALRNCDWVRGESAARRTLPVRETQEAYALLAMAHCCKPDQGAAIGMLRNVRERPLRAKAVAFCRTRGVAVSHSSR